MNNNNTPINMTLLEEWEKIITENQSIYIYGTGKIGNKIFSLIKETAGSAIQVKGFLVSDLTGNPLMIDDLPVMIPENLLDKTSLILVAVTEIYQDAIVQKLNGLGLVNVILAYKFSFIKEDIPSSLPQVIEIDSDELVLCQYKNSISGRYDIAVRLLAIENYFGKNSYGFDLYEKMRNRQVCDDTCEKMSVQRFTQLIKSYEKGEYDENSELITDEELQVIDGLHRLALAIYFEVSRLKVRIVQKEEKNYNGKAWFENLFSEEELGIIEEKVLDIEDKCTGTIRGILWPSVANYFDDIINIIRQQYSVSNVHDFVLDLDEFTKLTYDIYRIDSIAKWKINTKLKCMIPFSPYRIRIFDIDMKNPEFRLNNTGERVLSDKGTKLKEKIREIYKEKIIGYFPDIIFHTADNFYQSRYLEKLFQGK